MAKKKNPDKPTEIPKPENPEVTPETVPDRPTPPFQEPEIIPEDDPGGTSPGEIPVPDEPENPDKPEEPPKATFRLRSGAMGSGQ